jgi:hypothetical protein
MLQMGRLCNFIKDVEVMVIVPLAQAEILVAGTAMGGYL